MAELLARIRHSGNSGLAPIREKRHLASAHVGPAESLSQTHHPLWTRM